ncbi:MAG TPA: hypothetical protein VK453_25540 [Micromonosporaceae bacterium]|nr:hypothetical protein [Micromonosporaceae bacterium]
MTAYNEDSRVRRVTEYMLSVQTGDKYDVCAWSATDRWFAYPSLGSSAMRAADLRSREDTEEWLLQARTGPFRTADEAIASLIGDPR